MQRKSKQDLHWLEFDQLQEFACLRHGVFTRHGGVSAGLHTSLNVGGMVGDADENVWENRQRIHDILSSDLESSHLHTVFQVHGVDIIEAQENTRRRDPPKGDALMTCHPHQTLLVKHADCQGAIFYDPIRHALALVHSGWRGSVANIYEKTVARMASAYGTVPQDLLVCIGPSLGPPSSEFIHYKTELPEPFWEFQFKPFYFDFWKISEWQLTTCGILPHHIEIARLNTVTESQDWFSHRREKASGRNGTAALLLHK